VSFRMKKGVFAVVLLGLPFLLLMLGCAGEPTKQLADAKAALDKARQAEADKYAPDLFTQAENQITEAENLIAQKEYGEARKLLMDAVSVADQAASQAVANKENTKTEVEDYMAAINGAMTQLKETQDLAKQWNIPKKDRELTEEMAAWDENLKEAEAEYDAGNYYSAKELAAQIHQEVTDKESAIRELILAKQK
jgi:hypothetical protein